MEINQCKFITHQKDTMVLIKQSFMQMDSPFFNFCIEGCQTTKLVFLNILNLPSFANHFSISALWMIGLRPNDCIILYDCQEIREACKYYQKYFHYSEDQFIFWDLKGVESQTDVGTLLEKILIQFVGQDVKIVPMVLEPQLKEICDKLKLRTCSNQMGILPDKRMLQPSIPGSKYENNIWNLAKIEGVSTPRGYSCYSMEEIQQARILLKEAGVKSLYFKHAQALSGMLNYSLEDIKDEEEFLKILTQIKFDGWQIYTYEAPPCWIVEEKIKLKQVKEENILIELDLSKDLSKYNASIALSVIKDRVCYSLVNYNYCGHACAVTNYTTNLDLHHEAEKQYKNLAKVLQSIVNFPAEIEFLIDQNDQLFLTDLNFRYSSKDQVLLFLEKTGIQNKIWVHRTISLNLAAEKLAYILDKNKLLFCFEKLEGVVLDVPIPNSIFSSILFIGNNLSEVELMIQKTFDLIHQNL